MMWAVGEKLTARQLHGADRNEGAAMSDFFATYPDYASTSLLDELRAAEYSYLDQGEHVYLDYTGAGLPARVQIRAHAARMQSGCYGNPHSGSPSSKASTLLVEETRAAVLRHFNASPDDYAVIFTPNATGACRLVAEAYPFRRLTRLVLTADNHNSVNGIREFASARGARVEYVGLTAPDLRVSETGLFAALSRGHGARPGLLVYPAQSNFSGVQHPLSWVHRAQASGYDVLLDAAAFVPTNRLDLGVIRPEFVTVSWYKVFGYPTGVGCLLARRDALARLRRPWFSGGTIWGVSVQGRWHRPLDDERAFEDGTLNYLAIPDVHVGLNWVNDIGIDRIHDRVRCLTGWLLTSLGRLKHSDGTPMIRLYGPDSLVARGGNVAFNFLDPAGRLVDERAVERDASAAGISLRTGCFCNPGAAEWAFRLTKKDVRGPWWAGLLGRTGLLRQGAMRRGISTVDDYLEMIGLPTGGAVRVSLGLASTLTDVESFLDFAESAYRDRWPDLEGLSPRLHC
jgi:selenocysteine lyase/cysteine desulfurase